MIPIISSRLRSALPQMWPSHCTLRYTATGELVLGSKSIPCAMSVLVQERPTDDEERPDSLLAARERRHLKLNGYYPYILSRDMVAEVDGVTYQIRGVEHDSQHFSTRLRLEIQVP